MTHSFPAEAFPAEVLPLANGLTLIHQLLPTAVVVADAWLPVGTLVEPPEATGMAHFLEHMIFKGTAQLAPGDFDFKVETCGCLTNAATSHDYVHYYLCGTAAQMPQLLPLLADLLFSAAIPEAEFEQERQVVLEEILQFEDDPDGVGTQALWSQVYGNRGYGQPILGDAETLATISPEAMRAFYRDRYHPKHTTLVMVGGIERDRAIALAEQWFANPSASPSASPSANPGVAPAPSLDPNLSLPPTPLRSGIERHSRVLPQLEQARLIMAWTGPGLVAAPEVAAGLDLISVILTGGRLARLVRELREERRWVTDISSNYDLQQHSGLFSIMAWLEPDRLETVEQAIQQQLTGLTTEPITAEELRRAQRLLKNDFTFSLETPDQLAELYGYYHTVATLDLAWAYPQQLEQWHPQSLQTLAQHYLSPAHYTAMVLLPEPV